MKICRHCSEPIEPKDWQIKTGDYECAPCRRLRQAKYRADRKAAGNPVVSGVMDRDYHRAYEASYFQVEENRTRRNELMRKYRSAHGTRKRHKARWKVSRAISSGRLTREPCEVCGATKVHAHHDDYNKPLDVRWLCPRHHQEHHAKATGEQS